MIPVDSKKPRKNHFRVTWETLVHRKDGSLKSRHSGENSLIAAFAFMMCGGVASSTVVTQEQDITNNLRYAYQWYPNTSTRWAGFPITGFYNQMFGIVLGTDNTAVTADDYKLNTIIAAGEGGGQLIHMPCVVNDVVTAGGTSSVRIDRPFINHSTGTITVKELGIYAAYAGNTAPYTFCICRDVIADPGTDIDDDEYMFVKYTISVTE